MSDVFSSFGTLLELDDGTGTFVTVAGLGDVTPPAEEMQFADATTQVSPNRAEQKRPTILKLGDCTFKCFLDLNDPTHDWNTGLIYLMHNGVERNWKIHYTTNPTHDQTFQAYVKSVKPKAPVKGLLEADVALEVNSISSYA